MHASGAITRKLGPAWKQSIGHTATQSVYLHWMHDSVTDEGGNTLLAELVRRSRLYHFNYQLAALYSKKALAQSHTEHQQLVRALRDHDPDAAADAVRRHVESALETVRILQHLAGVRGGLRGDHREVPSIRRAVSCLFGCARRICVSVSYSYTPRSALRPSRPALTYLTSSGQRRNFSPRRRTSQPTRFALYAD